MRVAEEVFVAVVPLAGAIDRSTGTYVRRANGPLGSTDELEIDLRSRTLWREWLIGAVTVRWYTGERVPLVVPIPNECRDALKNRSLSDRPYLEEG